MIIGAYVEWLHKNEDGSPARDLEGMIVGLSRTGTPAYWSALVLLEDGRMEACAAEDLRVVAKSDETSPEAEINKPRRGRPRKITTGDPA